MNRAARNKAAPVEETPKSRRSSRHRRVCPECGKERVYRSRRRTLEDYFLSLVGLSPYRCHACDYRYHARGLKRPKRSRWAQCPRCTFTKVDRIARHKVSPTWGNLVGRLLFFPAYRCPECRNRFFDLRPRQPEKAEPS